MVTAPYLTEEIGIPLNKIRIFKYDQIINSEEYISFQGTLLEDSVLLLLINAFGMDIKKTRYLEIGANDSILRNNSWLLYQLGARGYLVDALGHAEVLSKIIRPKDTFLNYAVTDKAGVKTVDFYADLENTGLSSLNEDWVGLWKDIKHDIHKINAPAIEINELLETLPFVPNILLIDVESYDEKLLRKIDYAKYRPKIIIAELGVINPSMIQFMEEKGYSFFTNIKNVNSVFVKKDLLKVSLFKKKSNVGSDANDRIKT